MITEDYCSYEVSKLLKEKGFEGICDYAYSNKGNYFEIDRSNFDEVHCLRPTHQMAMKWLREDKYTFIEIKKSSNTFLYGASIMKNYSRHYSRVLNAYNTYEEVVEAALKYCLKNLI